MYEQTYSKVSYGPNSFYPLNTELPKQISSVEDLEAIKFKGLRGKEAIDHMVSIALGGFNPQESTITSRKEILSPEGKPFLPAAIGYCAKGVLIVWKKKE